MIREMSESTKCPKHDFGAGSCYCEGRKNVMEEATQVQLTKFANEAPDGATHYNFNGTQFPYEKHERNNIFVWANGKWELTKVPSCAVPFFL